MHCKTVALIILIVTATFIPDFATGALEGRGGGGGGGHIGGGGRISTGAGRTSYGGGKAINRTPSMSRIGSQRSTSRASNIQRPVGIQRQSGISRPEGIQRAGRSSLRQGMQTPSQQRPQFDRNRANQRLHSIADKRRGNIATQTQLRPQQGRQPLRSNPQTIQNARRQLNQNRPTFNAALFNRHNLRPNYLRSGQNWEQAATWMGVNHWLNKRWNSPYYYYPSGEYYALDSSYIQTDPSTYAEQAPSAYGEVDQDSYDQTPQLQSYATNAGYESQIADNNQSEWLPLGTYAVSKNAEQAGLSQRYLQIAMNREGAIEGVTYNAISDRMQNVTGAVDKDTQEVTLLLANDANSPFATTGLYNLTEAETPLNVRFNDGSIQEWYLLRLED